MKCCLNRSGKKFRTAFILDFIRKTAFGIDFGLWEVLDIDDGDHDDNDNDYYDVFNFFVI